jgi:hypothetical protein
VRARGNRRQSARLTDLPGSRADALQVPVSGGLGRDTSAPVRLAFAERADGVRFARSTCHFLLIAQTRWSAKSTSKEGR